MSGSWSDTSATAVDAVAIAVARDAAWAATMAAQTASGAFIVEHGSEVSPGHADVTGPAGEPADSDVAGVDASD